jgi:hypothetical protein
MKTSELQGPALDWAVAKCEGWPLDIWFDEDQLPMVRDDEVPEYKPSTDWSQGGPIIEREGIALDQARSGGKIESWIAARVEGPDVSEAYGPTPLIAAMRCYVASHLGDEIEVPNELIGE